MLLANPWVRSISQNNVQWVSNLLHFSTLRPLASSERWDSVHIKTMTNKTPWYSFIKLSIGLYEMQIYIICNILLRWIAHIWTLICIFLSPQWASGHRGGREEQKSHADAEPDGSEIWLIALLLLRTLVPPAWRTLSLPLSSHPSSHLFIFSSIICTERPFFCREFKFSIDGCLHISKISTTAEHTVCI